MAAIAEARRLISPTIWGSSGEGCASLAGLLLGLAGIGLGVALASYHPSDASFDTAGTVVRNLAGPSGAIFADLSWQGFGVVGVLPVCVMLIWGWRIAEHRHLNLIVLRLVALGLSMPLLAGGLANLPVPLGGSSAWLASGWGGAVGFAMGNLIVGNAHAALGPLGTAIAWVVEMLVGIGLVAFGFGLTALEWRAAGRTARTGAVGAATLSWRSGRRLAFGMDGVGRAFSGLFARLPDWGRPEWGRPEKGRFAQADEPTPHPIFSVPPMEADEPEPAATGLAARREAAGSPIAMPAGPSRPAAAAPAGGMGDPRIRMQKERRPAARPDAPALAPVGWRLPPISLLKDPPAQHEVGISNEALQANARLLETVLADYGVQGEIVEIRPGPVVTLYELEPAPGIRSARVIGLADDVARSLSVTAVRIATVPGRNVIGIEVPNAKRETVYPVASCWAAEDVGQPCRPAAAGAGQGYRRRAGHRRPRAHAASADRRHHRLRQVGRRQRDDPVAAVPAVARPVPADPDRPEDAGTVGL